MSDRLVIKLLQYLRDEKERVTEALANGTPKDYAEYRFLVGTLHGLQAVGNFISTKEDEDHND